MVKRSFDGKSNLNFLHKRKKQRVTKRNNKYSRHKRSRKHRNPVSKTFSLIPKTYKEEQHESRRKKIPMIILDCKNLSRKIKSTKILILDRKILAQNIQRQTTLNLIKQLTEKVADLQQQLDKIKQCGNKKTELLNNQCISVPSIQKPFQIFGYFGGIQVTLNCMNSEKIWEIKQKIIVKTGHQFHQAFKQITASNNGKFLHDFQILQNYGIQKDDTIYLNGFLNGGNGDSIDCKKTSLHSSQSSSSSKNSQYYNFNLNLSHKCSDANSHVQSFSKSKSDQKSATFALSVTVTDSYKANKKSFNYSTNGLASKFSKISSYNHYAAKDERKTKCDNDDKKVQNSSTLSIHIAAYENSIEVENDRPNLVESNGKNLCKFDKNFKTAVSSTATDLFEFPRQQSDEKSEPEVMQFKASQKLFNPSTVSDRMNYRNQAEFDSGDENFQLDFVAESSPETLQINSNADYIHSLVQETKNLNLNGDSINLLVQLAENLNLNGDSINLLVQLAENLNLNGDSINLLVQLAENMDLNGDSFMEVEEKRSQEQNLTIDFTEVNNESCVTLASDELNSFDMSPENDIHPSNDSSIVDLSSDDFENLHCATVIADNLNSKDLLRIALNLEHKYDSCESNSPPLTVSPTTGFSLCIIPANGVKNIADVFGVDKYQPWNSDANNVRAKQYYVNFEIEGDQVSKYERTTSKNRNVFEPHCFEYQAKHPYLPIHKKIICVIHPKDKEPVADTRIVFYYCVAENCDLIKEKNKLNIQSRIPPSSSNLVKQMLKGDAQFGLGKGNTPRNVFIGFNKSNSLMSSSNAYPAVTQAQILDQARHHKDRIAPTNKGSKPAINFEQIHRMAQNVDSNFVVEYGQTGNNINIFLANKTSLSMLRSCLTTKSAINKLISDVENAIKMSPNQRYPKLKEIVNSSAYKDIEKTCCFSLDTTFNLSFLHLTMLMATSPFLLRRKERTPFSFTGCSMLSTTKDVRSYEWMASCIDRHVLNNGKIARSFITDGDTALDAFLKCSIFHDGCVRLQCMVHFDENVKSYCDTNENQIRADIFGRVSGTLRYKGLLDELTFPEFEQKLEYLLKLDYWAQNQRLIEWMKKPSRRERIFKRYGICSRIRGAWGFNICETNTMECENMILKEDIDDMTPIPKLIEKVEARVNSQLLIAGSSFIQDDPVQLRDRSLFVGLTSWNRLEIEMRRTKFAAIGMEDADQLPGFQIVPDTFPAMLAPNMSEDQRHSLMLQSKKLEIFSSTPGVFVVLSSPNPCYVYTKDNNIKCQCNFEQKHQHLCVHVLAVHQKHPELKLIQKLEERVRSLSASKIHQIMTSKDSGAKPGTSRRRGTPATRNRKRKIEEIVDAELETTNTAVSVLNRLGTASMLTNVGPVSSYNSQRQLENLPHPVRNRNAPLHSPTVAALRHYKLQYNISNDELWFNGYPFVIKSSFKVPNAFNRQCAQCRLTITKQSHPFVITHLEQYEFILKNTNAIKIGFGERIICPTFACFITRYPYALPTCIISEIDEDHSNLIINSIFQR